MPRLKNFSRAAESPLKYTGGAHTGCLSVLLASFKIQCDCFSKRGHRRDSLPRHAGVFQRRELRAARGRPILPLVCGPQIRHDSRLIEDQPRVIEPGDCLAAAAMAHTATNTIQQ